MTLSYDTYQTFTVLPIDIVLTTVGTFTPVGAANGVLIINRPVVQPLGQPASNLAEVNYGGVPGVRLARINCQWVVNPQTSILELWYVTGIPAGAQVITARETDRAYNTNMFCFSWIDAGAFQSVVTAESQYHNTSETVSVTVTPLASSSMPFSVLSKVNSGVNTCGDIELYQHSGGLYGMSRQDPGDDGVMDWTWATVGWYGMIGCEVVGIPAVVKKAYFAAV